MRTSHLDRHALLNVVVSVVSPPHPVRRPRHKTPLHSVTEVVHRVGPLPTGVRLTWGHLEGPTPAFPRQKHRTPPTGGRGSVSFSVAGPSVTDRDGHTVRGGGVARRIPRRRGQRVRAVRDRMRIPPQPVLRRLPSRRHLGPDRLPVQPELPSPT